MLRSIASTLAGITVAVILITVMQGVGSVLFPPQGFADPTDIDGMARYVANQPMPAKLWLLLGYALGASGGVCIAAFHGQPSRLPAVLVGAFLLGGVVWNIDAIPHPLWLSIASVTALLFGALTGFGLGQAKQASNVMPPKP